MADTVGPDRPHWNDEVNTLVHGLLSPGQIEATREGLISWYRRSRAPDVPLYVTPDGDFLTPRRLAEELGAGTELGQSYLEIFLAGVLTDRTDRRGTAERIDEVVGMLRDATGEPWPFS
ncbi:MAG TPA: hypothetical protein VJ735_06875 [Actinomycetes bacterium]|nr:hypothetical protein [Actinomycetes bacterium]